MELDEGKRPLGDYRELEGSGWVVSMSKMAKSCVIRNDYVLTHCRGDLIAKMLGEPCTRNGRYVATEN